MVTTGKSLIYPFFMACYSILMIYPWQQMQWQQLQHSIVNNTLPHSLLFLGQRGMGKLHFAKQLAKLLLTQESRESAALFNAGNHPDFYCIQPLEDKKIISVSQVRDLQKQLRQTAHISHYQVAIIEPAEAMNIAASNALLKILEEPPQNTIIILVSHQPQRLPITVRSRCQKISFGASHDSKTVEWLQKQIPQGQDAELLLNLSHGAPLLALNMLDDDLQLQRRSVFKQFCHLLTGSLDPIQVANQWQKYDVWQILSWLQNWLLDIAKIHAGSKLTISNEKYQQVMTELAQQMDHQHVFSVMDKLNKLKKQLAQVNQLNVQLLLEDLLIGI